MAGREEGGALGRPMTLDTRRALAAFTARPCELLDAEDVAERARLPYARARRACHYLARRARITHVGGNLYALRWEDEA